MTYHLQTVHVLPILLCTLLFFYFLAVIFLIIAFTTLNLYLYSLDFVLLFGGGGGGGGLPKCIRVNEWALI